MFVDVKRLLRARERSQRGTTEDGRTVPFTKRVRVARGPLLDDRRDLSGQRGRVPMDESGPWFARGDWSGVDAMHGPEVPPEEGPVRPQKHRWIRRRRKVRSYSGTAAGCTAFVNDGPALALALAVAIARALALADAEP